MMAFLRSDVINRELIEKVLRKTEGTRRVSVSAITVGSGVDLHAGSLLHEQIRVTVSAVIKGRQKEYDWIAKIHRSEHESSKYARFQGIMETEVNFYLKLVPELIGLRAPMPKTFPILWGDYKSTDKEILLLENLENQGFDLASPSPQGLGLAHVILAVEWLAKFHGLSYVAMQRFRVKDKDEDSNHFDSWLEEHPWIRHSTSVGKTEDQHSSLNNEILESKDVSVKDWRRKLLKMAAESIAENYQSSKNKDETQTNKIDKEVKLLLQRQDWLENMKQDTWNTSAAKDPENAHSGFVTLCHGEPWSGNVQYRYSSYVIVNNNCDKDEMEEENGKSPIEAVFGGFHSCTIGKGGYDLAHFLLTSTTREFRTQNLELILKSYLSELDDVVASQGYPSGIYPIEELKADYKRGLVVAISFCVFVMPLLLPKVEESGNVNLTTKAEGDELEPKENSSTIENDINELKDTETHLNHQDSVDNGNAQHKPSDDDVVDGPLSLDKQFPSSVRFPDLAKERIIDGIKDVLEQQSNTSMHRVASMDYNTSL